MEFKMEKRKCINCGLSFTVLETSTQKYHSAECAKISEGTGGGGWKSIGNQAQKAEALKRQKEEGLRLVRDIEPNEKIQTLSNKKKRDSESTTKELSRNKEKAPENTTIKIETEKLSNVSSGVKTIKNVNSKPKENIMQKTKKDLMKSSSQENIEEIQPEVCTQQRESSPMVQSASMHLLDSTAEHLHSLMKGLTANSPDPATRAYSTDVVGAACNCAKNIREIMKLKLEAIKVQKELKR